MPNPLARRLPYSARKIVYDLLDWTPFEAQKAPLADVDSFNIIFAGGVGASKTEVQEKYLLPEVLPDSMRSVYLNLAGIPCDWNGKEVRKYMWLVSPDYVLQREVFNRLVDDLRTLEVRLDGPNTPQDGEWWLRIKDSGTEVSSKSANQTNSFHSKALTGICVDEAALVPDFVRRERLIPRLTRGGSSDPWMFASGTFEGMGGMANLYDIGQGPNEQGITSYSMSTWDNPVSFPNVTQETADWLTWYCQALPNEKELAEQPLELTRLQREAPGLYLALTSMPTDSFAQRYGARPQRPSGLVFPEFDQTKHVKHGLTFDSEREVEVWIDPGVQNPYAVLAVQFRGEIVEVVDELYYRQSSSEEMIRECIQRPWWSKVSGGQIDATQLEQKAIWQRSELWAVRGLQPPYLRAQKVLIDMGIERVRLWLRQPVTNEVRLHVSDKCPNLIKEFGLYSWDKMRGEEDQFRAKPISKHDHALTALWYGIVGKFGIGTGHERTGRRTMEYRPRFPTR